ncbi:MAG: hypothetical protein ACW981_14250 [Candidatus Hodarchaeales archaeon]
MGFRGKGKGKGKGKSAKAKKKQKGQKTFIPSEAQRTHRPDEGELFGIIIKILGGNHIEVMSDDDQRRVVRIPGKMNRRKWVRTGDLILLEPWYGMNEDKKADLKYVYQKNEYRGLFKMNQEIQEKLKRLGVERPVYSEEQPPA